MSGRLAPAPSDGRAFTSYVSAGQAENALQRMFGTVNENQYRRFLQHNSARVARQLRRLNFVLPVPARRR